jgi:hypothetical protein
LPDAQSRHCSTSIQYQPPTPATAPAADTSVDTIADPGALQIQPSVRATDCSAFDTLRHYFIYEVFSDKINRAGEIQRLNFLNKTIG